jgi:hypothetical protein
MAYAFDQIETCAGAAVLVLEGTEEKKLGVARVID